jgi:predicted aminopeptidase
MAYLFLDRRRWQGRAYFARSLQNFDQIFQKQGIGESHIVDSGKIRDILPLFNDMAGDFPDFSAETSSIVKFCSARYISCADERYSDKESDHGSSYQ